MIRLIEIYSRLEAVDGFLALMLQQPENYRERIIHDRIVGFVEHWLNRSLPGPAFFLFLSRWQNVPEVGCFLGCHGQFVLASYKSVREAHCNVWINQPADR
ncbi:hypothetical protein FHE25_22585 [Salmonella enterica]|uniref:hypothetical protein n=1 Tax=Salmonella enterica TaxID=28901 RepID=UPI0009AD1DC4|nr:hypothetical protein [Salmonella enterica]EAW1231289.1 hypothetical protein [Salmonella enterica subsp. enterica]ECG1720744.1 hypothetical protein [Salmonella enterica subsp. diarizonae serovar 17:z10:e,n,x,z15]ECI2308341.1 hypothetical protein [Salmonella enterica subsp. enterica serovar Infantis]ECS6407754.1 hypothetical protein [Salmonella enterica subsp. enterica serovar Poona]EDV5095186.1 hypothetical protein [Salmonella enterica subsp. salamae]EDW0630386.1 hypothetical protein [Salmo